PPSIKNPNAIPNHVPTLVANLWHFPTASANGNLSEAVHELWKRSSRGHKFPDKSLPLQKVRHAVTFRKVTVHGFLVPVNRLPKVKGAENLDLRQVTHRAVSNLTRKIADRALSVLQTNHQ